MIFLRLDRNVIFMQINVKSRKEIATPEIPDNSLITRCSCYEGIGKEYIACILNFNIFKMEGDFLDIISRLQQNKEDWKSAFYSFPLNKLVRTKKCPRISAVSCRVNWYHYTDSRMSKEAIHVMVMGEAKHHLKQLGNFKSN